MNENKKTCCEIIYRRRFITENGKHSMDSIPTTILKNGDICIVGNKNHWSTFQFVKDYETLDPTYILKPD